MERFDSTGWGPWNKQTTGDNGWHEQNWHEFPKVWEIRENEEQCPCPCPAIHQQNGAGHPGHRWSVSATCCGEPVCKEKQRWNEKKNQESPTTTQTGCVRRRRKCNLNPPIEFKCLRKKKQSLRDSFRLDRMKTCKQHKKKIRTFVSDGVYFVLLCIQVREKNGKVEKNTMSLSYCKIKQETQHMMFFFCVVGGCVAEPFVDGHGCTTIAHGWVVRQTIVIMINIFAFEGGHWKPEEGTSRNDSDQWINFFWLGPRKSLMHVSMHMIKDQAWAFFFLPLLSFFVSVLSVFLFNQWYVSFRFLKEWVNNECFVVLLFFLFCMFPLHHRACVLSVGFTGKVVVSTGFSVPLDDSAVYGMQPGFGNEQWYTTVGHLKKKVLSDDVCVCVCLLFFRWPDMVLLPWCVVWPSCVYCFCLCWFIQVFWDDCFCLQKRTRKGNRTKHKQTDVFCFFFDQFCVLSVRGVGP